MDTRVPQQEEVKDNEKRKNKTRRFCYGASVVLVAGGGKGGKGKRKIVRPDEVTGEATKTEGFRVAFKKEIGSWEKFKTFAREKWEPGMPIPLGTRTMYKWKDLEGGEKTEKCRICIQGCNDPAKDSLSCSSPTVSKASWRMCLVVASMYGWISHSLDVKTAFLQGVPLERLVYIRPPRDAGGKEGIVWRLLKAVYGLVDAPDHWYRMVVQILVRELGMEKCPWDGGLFILKGNGKLKGILSTHVDDFWWAGDKDMVGLIEEVGKKVEVGSECVGNFLYAGLRVKD